MDGAGVSFVGGLTDGRYGGRGVDGGGVGWGRDGLWLSICDMRIMVRGYKGIGFRRVVSASEGSIALPCNLWHQIAVPSSCALKKSWV